MLEGRATAFPGGLYGAPEKHNRTEMRQVKMFSLSTYVIQSRHTDLFEVLAEHLGDSV